MEMTAWIGKPPALSALSIKAGTKAWSGSCGRSTSLSFIFGLQVANRGGVERFASTFAASAEVMASVPSLAIRHFGGLHHSENLESFSDCLTRCGDGFIQLGFQATENGRPFKARLQNWSLPCLHKLVIFVILDFGESRSDGQVEVAVEDDENLSTCLIKSVLSYATALSELSLYICGIYTVPPEGSNFTAAFDSIILPSSLTKITVSTTGINQLEMMARSPLPNLESLTMCVGNSSGTFSVVRIIRILENCRKSLKSFKLRAIVFHGRPGIAYITRFPVMEQLVELSMHGVNVEPERGRDESLKKFFPKLATLRLPTQTIGNFQKWVGSSPIPGVTSLRICLKENSKASLNAESMQRVNFVFPNLRKLKVTMFSDDSSGLEYIFREMRQLTELEVKVKCNMERSTSSDIWDSLLTGVPVEVIARSKVEPDFWEKADLEEQDLASIKNLSELKKCSLNLDRVHGFDVDGQLLGIPRPPSISDFLFNCALLKMPKLTELELRRISSYNVSQEMIAKWRNDKQDDHRE